MRECLLELLATKLTFCFLGLVSDRTEPDSEDGSSARPRFLDADCSAGEKGSVWLRWWMMSREAGLDIGIETGKRTAAGDGAAGEGPGASSDSASLRWTGRGTAPFSIRKLGLLVDRGAGEAGIGEGRAALLEGWTSAAAGFGVAISSTGLETG